MKVQHRNFLAIEQLLPGLALLTTATPLRLESRGRPTVSVDVLNRREDQLELAIAYRIDDQPPALVRGMEMRIRVLLEDRAVKARSRSDHYGITSVERPLGRRKADVQRSLDDFLSLWLSNLVSQNYRVTESGVG